MSLSYSMPTKVVFGGVIENKELLIEYGKTCLIVTGTKSSKLNGSLDDLIKALESNNQKYILFDSIKANPTVDIVYEGSLIAKANKVDFIIGLGGGSPMDASKAIALLAYWNIPKEDIFKHKYGEEALPIVCIPTTAGTGSEVTEYSIITNDELETKTTIKTKYLFPKLAYLDYKYLVNLNKNTLINTTIDAYSHLIEGYLSIKANVITDQLALEGMRIIASKIKKIISNSLEESDYKELQYASTLGGMVIANTGTTVVHAIGYSLTYYHEVDHGKANGLVLPYYLEFLINNNLPKAINCLKECGYKNINDLIFEFKNLLLSDLKLDNLTIKKYALKAYNTNNTLNGLVKLNLSDIENIISKALGGV